MKALTLIQPWATLVALGFKTVETRSWATGYRGPLAIHAGVGEPSYARTVTESDPIISRLIREAGLTFDTLPRGGIIATADLYDVVRFRGAGEPRKGPREVDPLVAFNEVVRACGDFTPGRIGLGLRDIKPLAELVACRGWQSIWDVPEELLPLLTERDVSRA